MSFLSKKQRKNNDLVFFNLFLSLVYVCLCFRF
nr:MAG TPA: hypothetical protein [Caudoviricetes sp.]